MQVPACTHPRPFLAAKFSLTNFCLSLLQAENVFSAVEYKLYDIYDSQQPLVNERLQHLNAVLDRIATLEDEITEFKQSLTCLYQDTLQKTS